VADLVLNTPMKACTIHWWQVVELLSNFLHWASLRGLSVRFCREREVESGGERTSWPTAHAGEERYLNKRVKVVVFRTYDI
jgi:hypothetical protein